MIQPRILRDKVRSHLLEQIRQGKLQIGKTINLAEVARQTGISVTPVREALSQLEHARIIKAVPNRGFVIQPLGSVEAKHLYETIAQLEVMALENTEFSSDYVKSLREHFDAQRTKSSITTRFEFHQLLVQQCKNPILTQILNDLRGRLYFYEMALPENRDMSEQIETQNEAILDAIEENNLPTAALILKMHWMTVLERLRNQFAKD